jgi:hypothetical protein
MTSFRKYFRDQGLSAPFVGSWARRVAAGLEKTEGQGSWARRVVEDINAANELGPGSWTTKARRAIDLELLGGGGGIELIASHDHIGASSNAYSLDVPEGAQPGDRLLIFFSSPNSSANNIQDPAGLTSIRSANDSAHAFKLYDRLIDGTEPAAFSNVFRFSLTYQWGYVALLYRGVHEETPYVLGASGSRTTSVALEIPEAGCKLLSFYSNYGGTVNATTHTGGIDGLLHRLGGAGTNVCQASASEDVEAGTTGTWGVTYSSSNGPLNATVALRPAA